MASVQYCRTAPRYVERVDPQPLAELLVTFPRRTVQYSVQHIAPAPTTRCTVQHISYLSLSTSAIRSSFTPSRRLGEEGRKERLPYRVVHQVQRCTVILCVLYLPGLSPEGVLQHDQGLLAVWLLVTGIEDWNRIKLSYREQRAERVQLYAIQ